MEEEAKSELYSLTLSSPCAVSEAESFEGVGGKEQQPDCRLDLFSIYRSPLPLLAHNPMVARARPQEGGTS